ncbi:hypothetical protein [Burkholderia thailandensis]|nr:hypothetical protein [Burkholderia thailandensis]AIS96411.1 hypothetical protein BTHA_3339 [Burkholderia thailandensis MSMB59]
MRVLVVFAIVFALLVGYMFVTLHQRSGDFADWSEPPVFGARR